MAKIFAVRTEKQAQIYKIRSRKKSEPKELVAHQDVNLSNLQDEFLGLLGPNGTGKTTLIKSTG
ncbi:ATP-binding cassette domain-containing protein [Chloroflexota bacterium]